MVGLIVGAIVFILVCVVSKVVYNTFYRGKVESWFGKFVFNWTVKTFLIASCLGIMTCAVIEAEPASAETHMQ